MNQYILQKAIYTYGKEKQMIMAMEEMSELIKELSKNMRGENNVEHIAEEIADVEIMLAQLKIIHNCQNRVADWRLKKIDRLKARLEQSVKISDDIETEKMKSVICDNLCRHSMMQISQEELDNFCSECPLNKVKRIELEN